ncbi:unnamed protein product, partial [Brachionus calyciflorus]
ENVKEESSDQDTNQEPDSDNGIKENVEYNATAGRSGYLVQLLGQFVVSEDRIRCECNTKFKRRDSHVSMINLPDFNSINSILNELKNSIQHSSTYMINDLQKAIFSCSNGNARNLRNLKTLFECDAELLKNLIPKIIDLALDLPNRIKKNIPFLKQGSTSSISLSDDQCASLLANAFFCTFPNRSYQNNPEKMPFINFDCLYNDTYSLVKVEKLKCILNYFKCITSKKSDTKRIITFSRICNTDEKLNNLEKYLKESKLDLVVPKIYPEGTIEDHKLALQVDFA